MEGSSPDHVTIQAAAPEFLTVETAATDRVIMEAAAPDRATMENAAPDRATMKNAAPDRVTMEDAAPDLVDMKDAAPDRVDIEAAAPERVTMEIAAPDRATMETAAPDRLTMEDAAPDRVTVSHKRKRAKPQKRYLSPPKKVRNKSGTMTTLPSSLESHAAQTGSTSGSKTTSSLAKLLSWFKPQPREDDDQARLEEDDVFNPLQTPMDEIVDPAIFPIKEEMDEDTVLDGGEPETMIPEDLIPEIPEDENQVVQVKEEPAELDGYGNDIPQLEKKEPTPKSERPRTSRRKQFSCEHCPRVFRRSYDLSIHVRRLHSGVKPFTCGTCGQGFATGIERRKHLVLHEPTPNRQVKCDICCTYFKNGFGLFRHKDRVHKIYDDTLVDQKHRNHVCQICNESFEREDTKVRHFRNIHPEEYAAWKASREDDGEGEKICSFCGESFKSAYQLNRHERAKHAKEKRVCTQCGKEFSSLSRLRSHERWNHVQEPVLCSICGEECGSLAKLRRHERLKHREPEDHLCSYCGQNLDTQALLRVHERTHTGEKPFSCDICEKRFICKRRLWEHKKDIHERRRRKKGAEPISCSVCGRTVRKDSLKAHLKTHESERKFKCPYCELRFKTLVCMRTHTSVHTGEKPHLCGVCGKSFRLRDYLKTHMELHANNREKLHKCPTCDNRYMYSGGVRTHQKLTGCGGKTPGKRNEVLKPKAKFSTVHDALSLLETREARTATNPWESELVAEMSVDVVEDGSERMNNVFKSVQFVSRESDIVTDMI